MKSVDLMSLWAYVCSVLLCFSVRKRTIARLAGEFYLSQSAQSSRRFLAHISSSQNASGIQSSQSVTAKGGCNVLWNRLTYCLCGPLCVLFFCVFLWEKERTLDMRLGLWDSLRSFFSHKGHFFLSQNSQILQNLFAHNFELTERLRHTEFTERYC